MVELDRVEIGKISQTVRKWCEYCRLSNEVRTRSPTRDIYHVISYLVADLFVVLLLCFETMKFTLERGVYA